MSLRAVALASLVVVLVAAGRALAAPPARGGGLLDPFLDGARRTVLPNGLTLLTREQKGSGVVAINTWVKAGYFNESDEVAGMAHLFEHMFFKGSKKFPGAEQIAQEISKVGGDSNAGTIYDSTNYYVVLPKEGFRRGLEIQADAIANPLFDPAELKKEAEVVIEESNRKLDNPPAVSLERMFATAYTKHRMRRWRIGSNEVLRGIDRDNLVAFFQTLYRPGNIVLSIAGDVTHDEALQAAKASFGTLPKGTLKKERSPAEPAQTAFRFGQSTADLKQGYSVLGWHTVGVGQPDELTVDLLASILGDGRASRLYRGVVAPDGAATVAAAHYTFDDIGMLFIQASFDEANRAAVERRTLAEVERLRQSGPTAYELQLARNRIESGLVLGLESVLGQAQSLAQAESRWGYRALGTRLESLKRITTAEVRAAAQKYMTVENLTLYHYRPKGTPDIAEADALASVRAAIAKPAAQPGDIPLPPSAVALRGASATATAPQTLTLANGATLVVRERPGAPVVAAGIYFKGRAVGENSTTAGITRLMTRVMQRGTKSRSAEEIDRSIEFLGTGIGVDIDPDMFGLRLDILRTNAAAGLDLLADVVLEPTFPAEGLEEERAQQVAAIRRAADSSMQRPLQLAARDLWGAHPYALPLDGSIESVQSFDAASLRSWWERNVRADNAVVFMVGDIAAADAKALAEETFGRLPARPVAAPPVPPLPALQARVDTAEYRDRRQSAIVLLYPTVPATNPDWPKLRLLGNVTSGLAGTFFSELRGRRSLAYTVFASDVSRKEGGAFLAYLATEAAKENEATTALIAEMKRLGTDGITPEDLDRAKQYYAGSTRIRLQTNGALLEEYAANRLNGLGLDWTERLLATTAGITLDDLRATAGKYFSGDRFVVSVLRGKSAA